MFGINLSKKGLPIQTYKARRVNQKYDERKYPGRNDILQIRHNPQSEIAKNLELFLLQVTGI